MSYDMSFKGAFGYASAERLAEAIARFKGYEYLEDSLVHERDLRVDGLEIGIDLDVSASGAMWDETCEAISELSALAESGHIAASCDGGEGEGSPYRIRLLPGGKEEFDDQGAGSGP